MSPAVRFLTALSQALSTMSLYGDDHPATARSLDGALERLRELQEPDPKLQFTFLAGEVLVGTADDDRALAGVLHRVDLAVLVQPVDQVAALVGQQRLELHARLGQLVSPEDPA